MNFNVNFDNSNFDPDNIEVSEVMLVSFVIDKSGSISGFEKELNGAVKDTIREWKESHHAEKIWFSKTEFSTNVELVHGFQPIENVKHTPIKADSMTALFDAVYTAVDHANEYRKDIENTGGECKTMIFVFTDGGDNSSSKSAANVKKLLNEIWKEEYTRNSFEVVLFGLGDASYFTNAAKNMGVNCVTDDPKDKRPVGKKIRSMINIASQSVSSGNMNQLNNLVI